MGEYSLKDIYNVLTKNDAIYLLELIHESIFCNSDEDLIRLINKFNHLVPFNKIDPNLVRENCLNFRLQYWADTYRKYNAPRVFVSRAEDFGLKSGYTDGMRNLKGDKGSLFSFAGRSINRDVRTEILLRYFIPHLHQILIRIFCKKRHCNTTLSRREKEVLKWIKEGKSTWEISKILSISQNTVKFHIKQIMRKLDAVKRTQAVAIALEQGLIDTD
jgi:DNA-binding CsgD family transcriptional regulator